MIVVYFSPFIGLLGIMDHYQAEKEIPLDYDLFKQANSTGFHYWNPIENEFHKIEISQLFREAFDDPGP